VNWNDIPGWFQWRSAQEEAVQRFADGSRFVEVGNFLGRSLCSLGEVARLSGKRFTVIGVDTCRGSGIEGARGRDYHADAVAQGGGTFAGILHTNIIACGQADAISLIVADSVTASTFFADRSLDWVHLDARHDRAHVTADITAWLPKIKSDGWLSGDDYDEVKWPEVVNAVTALLPEARPWSINQWRWTRTPALEPAAPVNPPGPAGVICTLGVHRSGTSLVSRMLNLLGVHLGPDARVMTAGEDNPKGYWEHRPFVDINDDILARFGGRWDVPPVFPPQWFRDPRLEDLRAKARQLMAEDFATTALWGWKDPRTSLTLPFWQDVIGPMRYVICVRNPAAVVDSLVRRGNGMTCDKAEQMWIGHMQAILSGTSGQPRLFVFYEDILDDWPQALRELAAFVGDPQRADDPRVHEGVSRFLEKELCHHRPSLEDLLRDPRLSFATRSLYLALRGCAGVERAPGADPGELDGGSSGFDLALDLFAAQALESSERMAKNDALAAREMTLRRSLAPLESDLRLAQVERDRQARRGEMSVRALQEIRGSCAWGLVTLSRLAIADLLPLGSRRRHALQAVLRRIAPPPSVDPGAG
jgi:hypothetical protein